MERKIIYFFSGSHKGEERRFGLILELYCSVYEHISKIMEKHLIGIVMKCDV